jgi:hypothetical protein
MDYGSIVRMRGSAVMFSGFYHFMDAFVREPAIVMVDTA